MPRLGLLVLRIEEADVAIRCAPWTDELRNKPKLASDAWRDHVKGVLLDVFDAARERARVYRRMQDRAAPFRLKSMDIVAARADELLNLLDDEWDERKLDQHLKEALCLLDIVRIHRNQDLGRALSTGRRGDAA